MTPKKIGEVLFGRARDVRDPKIFHNVSLVAFLAWIGLGADGLSSSAYGPDEAYRALGPHGHLSIVLVAMTAITIAVIAIAYSNLIQHFPGGGGGYLVATKLLGEKAGVVSGCALLVDYVLTITTSIASGCDQIWNFLPGAWESYKLPAEVVVLVLLVILNMRGIKESVTFLAPIFIVFVLTHAFSIFWVFGTHFTELPAVFSTARADFHGSVATLGFWPVAFILLRAYSMGGGTYTGIEAVSNGVTMLREPRVATGKKTMLLMAVSLAFTAGGILFGYLLVGAREQTGKTMNWVLFDALFGKWHLGAMPIGAAFVLTLLVAEAALLFVAAQTGFLDGPRILSNMALDSWMPHRFAQLSSRLVTQDGVFLMGAAAVAALLYTRGNITTLIVMYSINVFITFSLTELGMARHWIVREKVMKTLITFSLTELGMARHWIVDRHKEPRWKSQLAIHGTGLVLCMTILTITLYEKFAEGGWMTTLVTSALIVLCFRIRRHYRRVQGDLVRLDDALGRFQPEASAAAPQPEMVRREPTAILTVDRFSGFGIHQILSIHSIFPKHFKNLIFVSVGVVDSGNFKGASELERLETETRENLEKYVSWARQHGWLAEYRMAIDTEAVSRVVQICKELTREFPRAVVFSGKLIFQRPMWYHRFLHNETALSIQGSLQLEGVQAVVLPVRVL